MSDGVAEDDDGRDEDKTERWAKRRAAALTLQVAGPLGNGIRGGKPIQSSGIRAVVAAEAAWRPCQPGSFRATLQCEKRMERKKGKKRPGR